MNITASKFEFIVDGVALVLMVQMDEATLLDPAQSKFKIKYKKGTEKWVYASLDIYEKAPFPYVYGLNESIITIGLSMLEMFDKLKAKTV